MNNFDKWSREFRSQNLYAFNNDDTALLWLKVRAVCRTKQLEGFLKNNTLTLTSKKITEQNKELFELLEKTPDAMEMLDRYLKEKNNEWYAAMGVDEKTLENDLYRIEHYEWGGDQNNSLDKHLVSRYVKVISQYDALRSKQDEIASNAWNYVQTSWYNNWTSYLIESLFKRHQRVISAVGEIKSVDFFIDNYPIDLKVTFFPSQYMESKLKQKLGCGELSWLRKQAKTKGITIDRTLSDSQQRYMLSEKLATQGHSDVMKELKEKKMEVIDEAQANTTELMKWLYENQGEMRFGAENRLFVILVDSDNIGNSWKMKRAVDAIRPKVESYLDNFNANSLKKIFFSFKNTQYTSLADVIFVVKR